LRTVLVRILIFAVACGALWLIETVTRDAIPTGRPEYWMAFAITALLVHAFTNDLAALLGVGDLPEYPVNYDFNTFDQRVPLPLRLVVLYPFLTCIFFAGMRLTSP
jgi:hypothetical protein